MERKALWFQWLWPICFGIVIVVVGYWWVCLYSSTTTVFLVRHADKAGPTVDDLSSLGVERAQKLIYVLGSAGVTAIYHSNTVRTRKTAEPLAAQLGLTPVEYPALDTAQLAADIRSQQSGGRVFVVGHSNTVPEIIERLGGARLPDIAESVYDNLYVVTQCTCSWKPRARVVNMKFGAPTP